jgi:hypothetical protein
MAGPNRTKLRKTAAAAQHARETQAVVQAMQAGALAIVQLRKRLRWARLAWALVALQAFLLVPSLIAFASLARAVGGPFEALRIVHWFVVESSKDFLP